MVYLEKLIYEPMPSYCYTATTLHLSLWPFWFKHKWSYWFDRPREPRLQLRIYTMSNLTMRLSPKSLQHSLYDIMSQPDTPLTNQTKQQSNWRKRLERNSWEVDNSSGSAGMRESSLLGCRNFIRTVPHYISIVPYYGLLDALHLYQRTHTTFDDYEWLRIL